MASDSFTDVAPAARRIAFSASRLAAAPFVALVAVIAAYYFYHAANALLGYPLPVITLLLMVFLVARFGSATAALLTLLGIGSALINDRFHKGSVPLVTYLPLAELFVVAVASAWAGCGLRRMCEQLTQAREQQAVYAALVAEAAAHRGTLLRDVLCQATNGVLHLCAAPERLPSALPFAPGEEPLALIPAALTDARERIRRAARHAGLPAAQTDDLVMASSEAALNAVVHGRQGVVEVRALPGGRVQVWVRDSGSGIVESHLHRAILEAGFSSKGSLGQGFSMITQTCDRVYLLTGAAGTTVVLEAGLR